MASFMRMCIMVMVAWACSACGTPVTYTGQAAGLTVQITLPRTPIVNESQSGIIRITRAGTLVAAQQVACDMQMPGMTMGANRPLADENSDGTYSCGLLFTMSGEWAIIVRGQIDQQPFDVLVEHVLVAEK